MSKGTPYKRRAGEGIEMAPGEMEAWVAHYGDLAPDPNAFRDANDPDLRLGIRWVISPDNTAGPAKIEQPHSFHLCYIQSEPGHHPVLHAHDYTETFICLRGQYTIHWGNAGENRVVLDPYDTFSVPPHVMRSVENTGTEVGMVMVIYGDHPDPNAAIVVPQSVIDADRAAGREI
jgi:uncharacterized RmlC-like cupin family protein